MTVKRLRLLVVTALALALVLPACGRKKAVKAEAPPAQPGTVEFIGPPEPDAKMLAEIAAAEAEATKKLAAQKAAAEAIRKEAEARAAQAAKAEEPVPPPPPKSPKEIFAEAKLERGAGRLESALEKALEAKISLEEDSEVATFVARLYFELNRDADALKALEPLVASGAGDLELVDTYVNLAVEKRLYARAAETLARRAEVKPDPALTGAQGYLRFKAGDAGGALSFFGLIKETPVYPRYAIYHAKLMLAAGETAGAREAASKATGEGGAAALIVAECDRAEGRVAAAEESLKAALKRSPEDYAAKVNLGALRLGQGDTKLAAQLFEEAAKARPELPEAWNNLGLARRTLGDHAGAEEAFKKALAAAPEFTPAMKNLGILLEKYLGRPAEAIPLYERHLKALPGDKDVERYLKAAQRAVADEAPRNAPEGEKPAAEGER